MAAAPAPAAPAPAAQNAPKLKVKPEHLQTFGISLGVGLGAMLVVSVIVALILMGVYNDTIQEWLMGQAGMTDEGISLNFFQFLLMVMALGVGGQYNITVAGMSGGSMAQVTADFILPASLTGVALLLGAAFGAYWMARRHRVEFRWMGAASALCVGVVSGLVLILLGFIFRFTASYYESGSNYANMTMSAATFRTFALAFVFATLGALAGYWLADHANDSSNVFTAAWKWAHRSRGPVRIIAETAFVYMVVSALAGLVIAIVVCSKIEAFSAMPLVLWMWPLFSFFAFVTPFFGGTHLTLATPDSSPMAYFSGMDGLSVNRNGASLNITAFNLDTWLSRTPMQASVGWIIWLLFAIMLVCGAWLALRTAARNLYDPAYADWKYSWQAPAFWLVFWLVVPYLFDYLHAKGSVSSQTASLTVAPQLWFSLVIAVWAFLLEVVARLLGPAMVQSMPGLWKIFVGGTVQLTPAGADSSPRTGAPATATASATVQPTTVMAAGMAAAPGRPAATAMPAPQPTMAVPAAQTGASAATAKSMSATAKRNLIIGGVVVAVVIVCGIVYSVLNSTAFSPKAVGQDYLDAIQSGDYDKATSMISPASKSEQGQLVDNAAAGDAGNRISNATVMRVKSQGGTKVLSISYTLAGEQQEGELKLVRKGSKAVFFSNWVLAEPLTQQITVSYPQALENITINGVQVSKENAVSTTDSSATYTVYPGVYQVGIGKSKFLTAKTIDINSAKSGDSAKTLEVKATDDLVKALEEQVDAKVDECAKSKDYQPSGCPFSVYVYDSADVRNFSWTVSKYPQIDSVNLDTGTFSSYDGTMKYTYEQKRSSGWTPDNGTTGMSSIYGSFDIKGDKVEVTIEDSGY